MSLNYVHIFLSSLFRYDNVWSDWRKISDVGVEEETLHLQLDAGEEITSICGYSWDADGNTRSLQVETSANQSWGAHGSHFPNPGLSSLRSSPTRNDKMKLNYISGDQAPDKITLRWHENAIKSRVE